MQAIQAAATGKTYPMDHYDGGRAAAEPEHYRRSELGFPLRERKERDDEEARTLALAIIALTTCGD